VLEKARQFAIEAHGGQKYGDAPYLVHLEAVVSHLADYDENARVIAYLHDVVEDTGATYRDVEDLFGPFIADCVAVVTDEEGMSRAARKSKTYRKMAKVEGKLELALLVKAADRLANVQACLAGGDNRRLSAYRSEHPAFRAAAYRPGLCDEIWRAIDQALGIA